MTKTQYPLRPFLYSRDWPLRADPDLDSAYMRLSMKCRSSKVAQRHQILINTLTMAYGWPGPLAIQYAKKMLLEVPSPCCDWCQANPPTTRNFTY